MAKKPKEKPRARDLAPGQYGARLLTETAAALGQAVKKKNKKIESLGARQK